MAEWSVHRRVSASGLQAAVKQARHALLRRTARAAWTAACRRLGHVTISTVYRAEPRAYQWLRRHDRKWLSTSFKYASTVHKRHGSFRLPGQQSRVAGNLQGALAALVEAGRSLPLNCREVLKVAGIPENAFRTWMFTDENFARAMRPFFHPQGIYATKAVRDRLLAL